MANAFPNRLCAVWEPGRIPGVRRSNRETPRGKTKFIEKTGLLAPGSLDIRRSASNFDLVLTPCLRQGGVFAPPIEATPHRNWEK